MGGVRYGAEGLRSPPHPLEWRRKRADGDRWSESEWGCRWLDSCCFHIQFYSLIITFTLPLGCPSFNITCQSLCVAVTDIDKEHVTKFHSDKLLPSTSFGRHNAFKTAMGHRKS